MQLQRQAAEAKEQQRQSSLAQQRRAHEDKRAKLQGLQQLILDRVPLNHEQRLKHQQQQHTLEAEVASPPLQLPARPSAQPIIWTLQEEELLQEMKQRKLLAQRERQRQRDFDYCPPQDDELRPELLALIVEERALHRLIRQHHRSAPPQTPPRRLARAYHWHWEADVRDHRDKSLNFVQQLTQLQEQIHRSDPQQTSADHRSLLCADVLSQVTRQAEEALAQQRQLAADQQQARETRTAALWSRASAP